MTKENINKNEILAKVTPVIEKVTEEQGLVPVEVNFVQEAGRWHLRIYIYNPKRPVSHEDCENLTKNLNDFLDQLISVSYYLEVSSPGIDRKLKSSKEYVIFKDKSVEIKLKQPLEGETTKRFSASIIEYSPEIGLKVKISDTGKEITLKERDISSVKLKTEQKVKGDKK